MSTEETQTYIYMHPFSPAPWSPRLPHNTKQSSTYYTVGPRCLSILNVSASMRCVYKFFSVQGRKRGHWRGRIRYWCLSALSTTETAISFLQPKQEHMSWGGKQACFIKTAPHAKTGMPKAHIHHQGLGSCRPGHTREALAWMGLSLL